MPAVAQKQPLELDSCLYRIPSKAFKRVPVLLEATADSLSSPVLGAADFFAQSVAFRLREMAGGTDAGLAEADSMVWWPSLRGEVRVTVHRSGPLTWRVPEWSAGADTLRNSALALLLNAVSQVVAGGENVAMPEGLSGDSVVFGLALVNPTVTGEGKILPLRVRQATPVFTIAMPREEPVAILRHPDVSYPELSRTLRTIGNVQLSFAVDRYGRLDMSTVKEVWPASVPRQTGSLLHSYEAFLAAVKRALPSAKFAPASIGGCPVKQTVSQSFEFLLRERRQ